MPAKQTVKKCQKKMLSLQVSINALTRRELRLGKPVSFGFMTVIPPNTTIGRTPLPFSGGN
jgi:hypothetical protein